MTVHMAFSPCSMYLIVASAVVVLQPENFLFTDASPARRVKATDFGLAAKWCALLDRLKLFGCCSAFADR